MTTEVKEYHVGNAWRYHCKTCNYQVGIDTAFPATCPGCGVGGWWGRLTTLARMAPASIDNHKRIMLPLNHTVEPPPVAVLEGGRLPSRGNGHRGRPAFIISNEDLKAFVDRGLGCKMIAQELASKGIMVHWTTVARHLKDYRQQD